MKKYFLLINVIVGFGCSSTVEQQAVIPSSQMVELLIDIHILEARVDKLRISKDSSYTIYNSLEKEIFEEYGISKMDYEDSYQFYLSKPTLLDQIYGIVVDSLNVIQKRGYQNKSEMIELDSINLSKEEIKRKSLDSLSIKGEKNMDVDSTEMAKTLELDLVEKPKLEIEVTAQPKTKPLMGIRDSTRAIKQRARMPKMTKDSIKR